MGSKTLVNVILIVSTWSITKAEQFSPDRPSPKPNLYPPEKVPWHSWVNHISNVHLTDMSAELVRDATYKLEIAYKIQKKYRSGYEFNIGIIVNNLHNYFDRMLLMYRDYSNLTLWRNFARNTSVFINGFHQIQGMYHKIRFEKSVFSALVRKKQKDTEEMMKILKAKQPDHPILHGIDGRRYKYNPHYKDGVAAKSGLEFYEWTYTKETFHADINNLNEYEDHDQLSDEAKAVILKDYWDSELIPGERNSFTQRIEMEKKQGIKHYGTQKQQIYACFYILTTFQNAIDDLRDYYRLRYLYVNNLEYEVGYLVQEIVYKYSVVLELFHLMQEKYYKQTEHKTIVPSSYMFYIYTHILQQSKQIIHLCNMAHELENKYKNAPLTVFKDYADREGLIENDDGTSNRGDGRSKYLASLAGNSTEEKRNKHAMDMLALHRENERIRQRKEAHENHKNLLKYGTYKTTERTRRPQTYGNFPRIYGWSIEYW